MEKLVSFIIPVYNSEKYIEENILSVVNQDYDNIEIITVDDGSSDKSSEIIKRLSKMYPFIQYIYQENKGAPAARNNGLRHAKGDYIYFIDSDDKLSTWAVSKMIEHFKDDKVDIVIGQFQHMDEAGNMLGAEDFGFNEDKTYTVNSNIRELVFIPPFPGNKMYRADFLVKNKVEFSDLKIAQDLNFYLKALAKANKLSVISDIVYYYRYVEGSISKTYTDSILDIRKSIKDSEAYYQKHDVYEERLFLNLRFLYYSYQLTKVPQIEDKSMRKSVFKIFKSEIQSIPKSELYKEVYDKKYWNTTLKLSLGPVFLTDAYQKFQQGKKK